MDMVSTASEVLWPNRTSARFFSSRDYLPGILRKIISERKSAQVSLPAHGSIVLDADIRLAYVDMDDAPEFFQAMASDFVIEPLRKPADFSPEQRARAIDMAELMWRAGFHSSQGRLDAHFAGDADDGSLSTVIRMRYWPNLTRLPSTPNAMRICALLTRFPTSVNLIPKLLSIDTAEVGQIVSAASCAGLIENACPHRADEELVEDMNSSGASGAAGNGGAYELMRSLFRKIQRL